MKFHKNRNELEQLLQEQCQNAYIFQEFVYDNVGNNIRLVVVGGKVIYSVLRKDTVNLKDNMVGKDDEDIFVATKEQVEIAEKIAKILDLDYCAIDFFDTIDNKPLVCEVNANPGGIDIFIINLMVKLYIFGSDKIISII